MDKPWDLKERTTQFMNGVCRLCRTLPDSKEAQEVASQLRRAARSVAANYRAAIRGRSHREFISKIGLVIEEADEAHFWLDHLLESGICQSPEVKELRQEGNELVAIFTTAQKTARKKRPPNPVTPTP
jgi:four helix bundle protein